MKIHLRQKANRNGKTSLFLEYYGGYTKDKNGNLKLKRKYEFLDIWIYTNPKNKEEREHNKELLNVAQTVIKKRELQSLNDDFNFGTSSKQDTNFIDYFTKVMNKKEIKKSSFDCHKSALNHLIAYCNPDNTTFKDINESFINGFKKYLDNTGLKNNTKKVYIILLKSVISEAFKENIIPVNPALSVKNYSIEETKKEYLTLEELTKLFNTACDSDIIKRAFLFSCLCGLRYSDVHNLKWGMVIKSGDTYKIEYRQIKTNSVEYLPLNIQAVDLLGQAGSPDDKVFKGLKYNDALNFTIEKWRIRAGITKHLSFHSSRHTFATIQLTAGADLYTVSKLLGHKNITTTQIYSKIIDDKKRQAIDNFPIIKINP